MALQLMPHRRGRRSTDIQPFWKEMEDFWSRFAGERPLTESSFGWTPPVDITESENSISVKAELPGLEPKDIEVEAKGDLLILKGQKKMEEERKEEKFYCQERFSGSFQRAFRLPSEVQPDKVDAVFKNGILTINIPKSEESKQRKIEIKSE